MMSSTGHYPSCSTSFQIGQWLPQHTCHRKVWHIRTFNHLHLINYHSEPVSKVNDRDVYSTTGSSLETKSGRILFPSDRKRMDLKRRFRQSYCRANLQHMGPKDSHAFRIKMIGVVFHK